MVAGREKGTYCSFCGEPFPVGAPWPRRCPNCREVTYRNPLPVSVVLLPVNGGLLAVRRAIDPGKGELALPGGFIEAGESWQEAAVRELREETGVVVAPAAIGLFDVASAPDGTLLIFGMGPERAAKSLTPFEPRLESSELVVIEAPTRMAFSLHTRAVKHYFQER